MRSDIREFTEASKDPVKNLESKTVDVDDERRETVLEVARKRSIETVRRKLKEIAQDITRIAERKRESLDQMNMRAQRNGVFRIFSSIKR